MKNKLLLITCIIFTGFTLVQSSTAQVKSEQDLQKHLTVKLQKSKYLLLEPVFVKLRYSVSPRDVPVCLSSAEIKIFFNGKIKEFIGLTQIYSTCCYQTLPSAKTLVGILSEGKNSNDTFISGKEVMIDRVKEFFPEAGDYKIQLSLNGATSDLIDITVEEPAGIEKEAFDFLNKRKGDISFYWIWEEKNGIDLLKDFADKYGQTVYGEYAIQTLANLYLVEGKLNEAKTEFEKISSARNSFIAESAKKSLEDIKKKKADLEKQRKSPR